MMAIPLEDYEKIHSRPGRATTGDDGFALTEEEDRAFDKAWALVGEDLGVEQLPNQPSEDEIRQGP